MPRWGYWPLIGAVLGGGAGLVPAGIMALTPLGFAPELLLDAVVFACIGASLACAVLGLLEWTAEHRAVLRATPRAVRKAVLRGRAAPLGAEPQAAAYAQVSTASRAWTTRQLALLYLGLMVLFTVMAGRNSDLWLLGVAALLAVILITVVPTLHHRTRRLARRAIAPPA